MGCLLSRVSHRQLYQLISREPSFTVLRDTRLDFVSKVKSWKSFHHDAIFGVLPNYTFLEPNYGQIHGHKMANDGHATSYFFNAEYLLKDVYETLRLSPQWNHTLLLITYDEHGGMLLSFIYIKGFMTMFHLPELHLQMENPALIKMEILFYLIA